MDLEKTNSGETTSCWMNVDPILPPQGQKDLRCDVCVVGAGIAGLTTAYFLAKEGKSVIVLDMGPIAGGQTGRTTSHLTWAMDDGFSDLIKHHGVEKSALYVQSHREAINLMENIISEELIDCDFERVDGHLFLGPNEEVDYLQKELQSIHKLGFQNVDLKNSIPHLSFDAGANLVFPRQAQLHPIKYMNGLANAIERYGGQIYIHEKVKQMEEADVCKITLEGGSQITASNLVVASNSPINDRFVIHTKQAPYRSYAVAALIPKDSVPLALYWDTADPYHYIRVAKDDGSEFESDLYDLLIVGGEDHKTGQGSDPHEHFLALERWARHHFPMILSFRNHWSGQVWETVDGIAYIGLNPGDEKTYIATGDSGQGMTHGTIAGRLLTDLIMDRSNAWTEVYNPSRWKLNSSFEYLKENLNVAFQYKDYFKNSEVESIESLKSGEGAVLQKGIRKIAVSKNERGVVTELSAVCPHLGGIVHWNSVEKSWDCPCHGSRFACDGSVITGPSLSGLEAAYPADEKDPAYFQKAVSKSQKKSKKQPPEKSF